MQRTLPQLPEIKPADSPEEFLELETTELYDLIRTSTARIIVLEGGVRSGKTYAIAQALNTDLQEKEGPYKIEIVRATLPALKATAMEDFFGIMRDLGLYREEQHNKTDHVYREGRNSVGFFPVDDAQKLRGRKRNKLWVNEANELTYAEFMQLVLRTTDQIILDFNPVEEDHWLFEKVLTRNDVEYIHSDYRCNPFLEEAIIQEIERMKDADPQYWATFGLGERPKRGTKIYQHYTLVDDLPENPDAVFFGLDFGFNVATALIKIARKELAYTWDEQLYKTNLTNRELIEELKRLEREGVLTTSDEIFCDNAEPDRIQEICDAGFNAKPADKAVEAGIIFVKGRPLAITKRSLKLLEELKLYSWKTTKDGKILDEPVKVKDHAVDAGRYGEYTHGKELSEGGPNIRIL